MGVLFNTLIMKDKENEKMPFDENTDTGKGKSEDTDETIDEIRKKLEEKEKETIKEAKKDNKVTKKDEKKIEKGEARTISEIDSKTLKDLQREIEELKKKVSASERISYEKEDIDDEDFIKEDYLDEPVTFFAFSSYYGIYGDKRKSHNVPTPYNRPFQFKRLYRTTKPSSVGRGVEIITVSQCVVRSKIESEWLRDHTLFNIKFFESIEKAKNINALLAEKMGEANSVVSKMSDQQILERAQREDIDIVNPDISEVRKLLIHNMAKKAMRLEKEKAETSLKAKRDGNDRIIEDKKITEKIGADDVY